MAPFAAFVIAGLGSGCVAGTTRPDGSIGLPGGKLDPSESPEAAVLREAAEEGWQLPSGAELRLVSIQMHAGREIRWYATASIPQPLRQYKEASRGIRPIPLTVAQLQASGMGNDDPIVVAAAISVAS